MRNSLLKKFILAYIFIGLVSFLLVTAFSEKVLSDRYIKNEADALYREATELAASFEELASYSGPINQQIMAEMDTVSLYTGADIWMVSSYGVIVYNTPDQFPGAKIQDFDPADNRGYVIGNMGGIYQYDVISVISPITSGFNTLGYVMMHVPVSAACADVPKTVKLIYFCCAIVYAVSFLLLIALYTTVCRPLRKISRAAGEYAKGNLSYRIKTDRSRDEMEYLEETLNYMAEEQQNLDKYQRDFVANVSHDFRSPLTSIKGYLEAILDGTIPEEMHEKYIRRVISEADRLHKLTEEMLTLGNLDTKGMLSRTVFDINSAIKDVCASYENACREKNLTFELLFEEPNENVHADREKIQRVIYNLIDNAIKFSYPNTNITISTSVRQKKVYVSILDRGEGIPKKSLKKIWERFYKEDSSRGKDKKGTGLGLAIVKEIITAHGENIDVVSTEKVGTEFTFTLPVAE
ncbi:MAG: HAMP domain-containing histidine kinase [Lachnospiraceae bacterium]|nr:HAMP domain-containing histidine kinase [Lachnospiraceae bacterium]